MAYVNYVDGVPVSIQLNERDLLAKDGVVGRLLHNRPISNWQQNMMLRNRALMSVEANRTNLKTDAEQRRGTKMATLDTSNSYKRVNQNNTILNIGHA